MTRVWKAAEKREHLAKRQRNRCYWCKEQMSRKSGHPRQCTLDHIVPRSVGGGGAIENLVASCRTCNEARGSTPHFDYAISRAKAGV